MSNYISHSCEGALRGCWGVEWPQLTLLPLSGAGWRKIRKQEHKSPKRKEKSLIIFVISVSQSLSVKEKRLSFSTDSRGPTVGVNATSLTLSSKHPSISRNLWPLRPTLTHFVWIVNTWAFLTDQKAIAETLCCLLDNRGSISECCRAGLYGVGDTGWGPGQRCGVRWISKHLMSARGD